MLPQPWRLSTVLPPGILPVSVEEVRTRLRIDFAEDGEDIRAMIAAATDYAEQHTGLALVDRLVALTLDRWPRGRTLSLPLGPLRQVGMIRFFDAAGGEGSLDLARVIVDTAGARIALAEGAHWPDAALRAVAGVEVTYTAGFGASGASVPEAIRQAIMLLVGHYYERREDTITGTAIAAIPMGAKALLDAHRRVWV